MEPARCLPTLLAYILKAIQNGKLFCLWLLFIKCNDKQSTTSSLQPWRMTDAGLHLLMLAKVAQDSRCRWYSALTGTCNGQASAKLMKRAMVNKLNDLNPNLGLGCYEDVDSSKNYSGTIWDYSDNEVVPASSWSALSNSFYIQISAFEHINQMLCNVNKQYRMMKRVQKGCIWSLVHSVIVCKKQAMPSVVAFLCSGDLLMKLGDRVEYDLGGVLFARRNVNSEGTEEG
ncbi:tubby like protein 8 [Artemisia annua]|uniref:Tubby like protein 8 n=1 Tax=Artemisia annua TaxID=35608 RepID=A0A2U1P7M8_ARTAN|nr:tubby like protein 8 [Artemisia annua]